MAAAQPPYITNDADDLVEPSIALVGRWLRQSTELETRSDRASMQRLEDIIADDEGVRFVMQFVDRVARPDDPKVAAEQLNALVASGHAPAFLGTIDKLLLKAGAVVAPLAPTVVMKLATARMRSIVGHLVAPAEPASLTKHLERQGAEGYQTNVNLLGEAVLGEGEATRRRERLMELLRQPEIDYVSVKITAVVSKLDHWAPEQSLERLTVRLAELVDTAAAAPTPTFVNFDMEEYHDLHLTMAAFKAVLGQEERLHLDAGIVIQAYLPDSLGVLTDLVAWANDRHARGGGTVKIRLVKGANLAMERVEATMHGWEQAPYGSKLETDAGYRSCLDWLLHADRLVGVRVGIASHNLFDVAWAKLIAEKRGVIDRIQFEMLQGMAPGQARAVNAEMADHDGETLLYTPAVAADDFDVAISYLFRRLEENAAPENYLRHLFELEPDSPVFVEQAQFFRDGVARRHASDHRPRRNQNRSLDPSTAPGPSGAPFRNEPDTDPTSAANRPWIDATLALQPTPCRAPLLAEVADVEQELAIAQGAQPGWAARPASERRTILHRVADELGRRRSEILATMMHEANKTIGQGDVEVSEAVDFARWYGDHSLELDALDGVAFEPLGTVAVIPPWNFPVAIPAGGVVASLAAGNAVVFKPAPQTPRCAEIVAEACWAAGVPDDVLRFVRTPDNDAGRHLVEAADAVILTGSSDTAEMFRSWKPDINLFAETSGKNALIITPSADIDRAVEDLVASAFGHGGQKCSAASLAILVGSLATSERFQRQLVDAVKSLAVGEATVPVTDIPPLVDGGNDRLTRAVDTLDPGESWLVRPQRTADGQLSPGVRAGVAPDSWFHRTECFGPILGIMTTDSLEEAIAIANSSEFGLTGGIHSLDPDEIQQWADSIEIGNGYVNRPITGAIVQRQPFGGWKRSVVGPGAKAGGPNYLLQLGHWTADPDAPDDFDAIWAREFAQAHDPADLFCEANYFRYRPIKAIAVLYGATTTERERTLLARAAKIAGVEVVEASPDVVADPEARTAWLSSLVQRGVERVRFVNSTPTPDDHQAAQAGNIHISTAAVTASGRLEFLHLVREQAISVTLHRFGNLVNADELRL